MGDILKITATGKRYRVQLTLSVDRRGCDITFAAGRSPQVQATSLFKGIAESGPEFMLPIETDSPSAGWHDWREPRTSRPLRCTHTRYYPGEETQHCELARGHGGPHHFVPIGVRPSLAEEYTP